MIKKQSHVHVYQKFPLREKNNYTTMSNENKVWLKKLVKSSETYLKLKSKLQKERDMNKMLMEHLMSMRCVEKDVDRILKKVSGLQSHQKSEIYIKEEPGQEPISVDDFESDSELDGGFAKIHISEETKTETETEPSKNIPKQEIQTNVEEAVSYVLEEPVEEQEETEEIVEEVEVEETEEIVEEQDEEQNVFEIEYKGTRYYTTDETNGAVYAVQDDDDIGDQIGNFVNGKLVLL